MEYKFEVLVSVTDPRSGLTVGYPYGPDNWVATVTAPGEAAYTLTYTTLSGGHAKVGGGDIAVSAVPGEGLAIS